MIILFISNSVNQLLDIILFETFHSSSQILSHINRSSIRTQQQFLVKTFVGQIAPDRTVVFFVKNPVFQTFLNQIFPKNISIALVLNLVKINTQSGVSLIKSSINPFVHHFPKLANFRVVLLPFQKHFLSFDDRWRLFFCRFLIYSVSNHCFDFGFI